MRQCPKEDDYEICILQNQMRGFYLFVASSNAFSFWSFCWFEVNDTRGTPLNHMYLMHLNTQVVYP